jgi:hypothetical protein
VHNGPPHGKGHATEHAQLTLSRTAPFWQSSSFNKHFSQRNPPQFSAQSVQAHFSIFKVPSFEHFLTGHLPQNVLGIFACPLLLLLLALICKKANASAQERKGSSSFSFLIGFIALFSSSFSRLNSAIFSSTFFFLIAFFFVNYCICTKLLWAVVAQTRFSI